MKAVGIPSLHWVQALKMEHHLTDVMDEYNTKLAVFIRGDMNASSKNKTRSNLLSAFVSRLELSKVFIQMSDSR